MLKKLANTRVGLNGDVILPGMGGPEVGRRMTSLGSNYLEKMSMCLMMRGW